MRVEPSFELFEFCCEFCVGRHHLTQFNEGADDPNAGLNSDVAVQYAREHKCTMFCEDPWQLPLTSMQTRGPKW